jgi:hypothetical protein
VLLETVLYDTIARLSYLGDIRMTLAEDPHKVERIVTTNLLSFQQIYRPILNTLQQQQHNFFTLHCDAPIWSITFPVRWTFLFLSSSEFFSLSSL